MGQTAKRRVVIWVVLAVVFVILAIAVLIGYVLYFAYLEGRFANVMGREEAHEVPEPWAAPSAARVSPEALDPWSIPAAPVDVVLVIHPLECDLELVEDADWLTYFIRQPWNMHAPEGFGVEANGWSARLLGELYPYGRDPVTRHYDLERRRHLDRMEAYWEATHTIEGRFEADPRTDMATVTLRFTGGEGAVERTFVTPMNEFTALGAEVAAWMIEEAQWDDAIAADVRARLTEPMLGPAAMEYGRRAMVQLLGNCASPDWDRLMAGANEPQQWILMAMRSNWCRSENPRDVEIMEAMHTRAMASSDWLAHRVRSNTLHYMGEHRDALAEAAAILATRPGLFSWLVFVQDNWMEEERLSTEYLTMVEQWAERVPPSPARAMLIADAAAAVADAYRGTDYAHTVSAEGWRVFGYANGLAEEACQAVLAHPGVMPHHHIHLIRVAGSGGGSGNLLSRIREAGRVFTHHYAIWATGTNYLRPRWGGSHALANEIIIEAMQQNPKNPFMAQQVIDYHRTEMYLLVEDSPRARTVAVLREYYDKFPNNRDNVLEVLEMLDNTEPAETAEAVKHAIASVLLPDEVRPVYSPDPKVLIDTLPWLHVRHRPLVVGVYTHQLLAEERWEDFETLIAEIRRYDALRYHPFKLASDPLQLTCLELLIRLYRDKDHRVLDRLQQNDMTTAFRDPVHFALLVANRPAGNTIAYIRMQAKEIGSRPGSIQHYKLALAEFRDGKIAEAQQLMIQNNAAFDNQPAPSPEAKFVRRMVEPIIAGQEFITGE